MCAQWGKPYAYFKLGKDNCNPDHFANQKLIFDTTLCGDDAGNKWESSGCAAKYNTGTLKKDCEAFVRAHPGNFTEAYWELYNVSVWAIKTGIEPHHPDKPAGTRTIPMGKYAIIALVCVGACALSMCGWKCWIESRDSGYEREGRRAENHARLNDTSGWEYAQDKAQSPNKYGTRACRPSSCLLVLANDLSSSGCGPCWCLV